MDVNRWESVMAGVEVPSELESWLVKARDEDLFRINLKTLGNAIGIPWKDLLSVFFKAVKAGAFTLSWEYHCPHCNGIPDFRHNLNELKSESYCGLCTVSFRNTLDKNVEVTFTVHPSLHEIPDTIREASKQKMLAAIQAKTLTMPSAFLSGLECMNNPIFQEIFGEEVLSADESLEISRVTLLFTDIKGSTDMYSRLGDTASYRIVRDHFKILFQSVEKNGGVVVKTIGDAIMASFLRPEDGVKAALSAYDAFKDREWNQVGKLEIKMGLHTGGVIVVNLNERVDYFGNTVNKAARIQGLADNHTVCFSESILEDPTAKKILAQWTLNNKERVYHSRVKLKGIEGEVDFYRLVEPQVTAEAV